MAYQRLLVQRSEQELRQLLEKKSRRRLQVQFRPNSRLAFSSLPLVTGTIRLFLHPVFLFAPDEILLKLSKFVVNPLDYHASTEIDRFITTELRRVHSQTAAGGASDGRFFDLQEIFNQLNETYFDNALSALIRWSRGRKNGGRKRSIVFGTYTGSATGGPGIIKIHPALDQDFVPRSFVEFVVYHEMLHIAVPPMIKNGRRVVHSKEFRSREAEFRDYHFATQWEKSNLHRFIG